MKFSTNEDMGIPIEAAFAELSDFEKFENFEKYALRKGVDLVRIDALSPGSIGMMWRTELEFRGKHRKLEIELMDFQPPETMEFRASSPGFDITVGVDLTALAPARCRLKLEIEAKPKNLTARLMLQSVRLAKSSLNRRFKNRVHDFVTGMETRIARNRKN
jgi:hypothetical protein